jgi:fatty-acyl-CoA synthase
MGRAAARARGQAGVRREAGVSDAVIKDHLKVFADKGIISKYGIPEKILFVDSIPKTSVGKINKKELRERYGDM